MDIILKNRGNYKELLTFKKATVIYDLTYHFCHKYLKQGDRTVDQMIQAARSGKQNIAEGVAASATNAETEIRLVNVAKASLKELLTDFEDYLRTRRLRLWNPAGEEIAWLRKFAVEFRFSKQLRAFGLPLPLRSFASHNDCMCAELIVWGCDCVA